MSTIDELVYYCHEKNAFGALMLTGEWGCGKTYLIENDLPNILKDEYIIIRISLFGESSIDSINQKIQKAYFQKLLLNLGDNVEDMAKELTGISDEKAEKLKSTFDKATIKITDLADKVSKSKYNNILTFFANITKKLPGIEKVLSINPSEFIPIENTIGDKIVVLIFDDFERSNLDVIDILGTINEYCENKHFKTIIIANEDKIILNSTKAGDETKEDDLSLYSSKIDYSEIKEKIVSRTIKHIPDYDKIINQIIAEYQTEKLYKEFLMEQIPSLINIFKRGTRKNIRSIKCAIQDFERVYSELKRKNVENNLNIYFQTFVSFMLMFKDGKIKKSDRYGYLFSDNEIEKEYPDFYKSRYMLNSVKEWLLESNWHDTSVSNDIDKIIESEKAQEPRDIVRNMDLIYIDEETLKLGLPDVIELAYKGDLSVDEYITLLKNIMWSRTINYSLPQDINTDKLLAGVEKCLNNILNSDNPDTRVHNMIHPDNEKLLTTEETTIYQKICSFRDQELQMFAINKRKYLTALNHANINEIYDCENKRFNIFDNDMATAVGECYIRLNNSERSLFISNFKNLWERNISTDDLQKELSISHFKELKETIIELHHEEQEKDYGLKAALSNTFIKNLDSILELIEVDQNTKKI